MTFCELIKELIDMKSVLVFCGSSKGNNPSLIEEVKKLARLLASQNVRLIYGGGNVGLMGIIANEVLDQGGQVLGVIPEFLRHKEVGNLDVTELVIVKSMHERKAHMCDQADYVITLPGGFGTMDELFEMLTWLQLGLHSKPIGILNFQGFYDSLIAQLDKMIEQGFLKISNKELLISANESESLLKLLLETKIVADDKWFTERNLS